MLVLLSFHISLLLFLLLPYKQLLPIIKAPNKTIKIEWLIGIALVAIILFETIGYAVYSRPLFAIGNIELKKDGKDMAVTSITRNKSYTTENGGYSTEGTSTFIEDKKVKINEKDTFA